MSSVQYKDTFLLVGGWRSNTQFTDAIYQYDQTSETWILREERLSTPKGYMGEFWQVLPQLNAGDAINSVQESVMTYSARFVAYTG